jgi:hypothetical protein
LWSPREKLLWFLSFNKVQIYNKFLKNLAI